MSQRWYGLRVEYANRTDTVFWLANDGWRPARDLATRMTRAQAVVECLDQHARYLDSSHGFTLSVVDLEPTP